jgi:hypothetical protein
MLDFFCSIRSAFLLLELLLSFFLFLFLGGRGGMWVYLSERLIEEGCKCVC